MVKARPGMAGAWPTGQMIASLQHEACFFASSFVGCAFVAPAAERQHMGARRHRVPLSREFLDAVRLGGGEVCANSVRSFFMS